uniref:Uncharacterized protein n=1 Tax=Lepeophtheirus salmonis TaxID=72036 RepID=A0A0K2UX07_LEPSM
MMNFSNKLIHFFLYNGVLQGVHGRARCPVSLPLQSAQPGEVQRVQIQRK